MALGDIRVAVIGDSMTDVYIHGHLAPSQDGCQKFVEETRIECPGGAANAAWALWKCECFGNTLQNGPVKTRYLVDNVIVFRHDIDTMEMDDDRRFSEVAAMESWNPDAILISDYDKGFLTETVIQEIIDYAATHKIPCVADAKRPPSLYRGAILKCNRAYAERFYPFEVCADIVVTSGSESPTIRRAYSRWLETVPAGDPVTCVNHVGAGDCFAAHMTLALAHGHDLVAAAAIAHQAGRAYVQYLYNGGLQRQFLQDVSLSCIQGCQPQASRRD